MSFSTPNNKREEKKDLTIVKMWLIHLESSLLKPTFLLHVHFITIDFQRQRWSNICVCL